MEPEQLVPKLGLHAFYFGRRLLPEGGGPAAFYFSRALWSALLGGVFYDGSLALALGGVLGGELLGAACSLGGGSSSLYSRSVSLSVGAARRCAGRVHARRRGTRLARDGHFPRVFRFLRFRSVSSFPGFSGVFRASRFPGFSGVFSTPRIIGFSGVFRAPRFPSFSGVSSAPRFPNFSGVSSVPCFSSLLSIPGARALCIFDFTSSRTPAVSRGFHEAPGDESLQDRLGLAGNDKDLLHGKLGTTEEFEAGLCLVLEKRPVSPVRERWLILPGMMLSTSGSSAMEVKRGRSPSMIVCSRLTFPWR